MTEIDNNSIMVELEQYKTDIKTNLKKYTNIDYFISLLFDYHDIKFFLFGSAVWRLAFDIQDSHDFDLCIQTDNKTIQTIIQQIETKLKIKIDMNLVRTNLDMYHDMFITNINEHYEINIDGHKLDIILISDAHKFIINMNDIDNGLLFFDFKNNAIILGQDTNKFPLILLSDEDRKKKINENIYDIFQLCKNKEIGLIYFNMNNGGTSFWRLIKMLNYGFTIKEKMLISDFISLNIIEINNSIKICSIFASSFCIEDSLTLPIYKKKFIQYCINKESYEFMKIHVQVLFDNHYNITNNVIDCMIAFALLMDDFEYAIFCISKYLGYNTTKQYWITLNHIPKILRTKYTFEQCCIFINAFETVSLSFKNIGNLDNCQIMLSNVYNLRSVFSIDAIKSGNMELYNKIKTFNSKYDFTSINMFKTAIISYHPDILTCIKENLISENDFYVYIRKLIDSDALGQLDKTYYTNIYKVETRHLITYMLDKEYLWKIIQNITININDKEISIKELLNENCNCISNINIEVNYYKYLYKYYTENITNNFNYVKKIIDTFHPHMICNLEWDKKIIENLILTHNKCFVFAFFGNMYIFDKKVYDIGKCYSQCMSFFEDLQEYNFKYAVIELLSCYDEMAIALRKKSMLLIIEYLNEITKRKYPDNTLLLEYLEKSTYDYY